MTSNFEKSLVRVDVALSIEKFWQMALKLQ